MDGNGRWARSHRLNRLAGHNNGATTVRKTVTACCELGVDFLTLYAFSEENWKRPAREISTLMKILNKFLVSERDLLKERQVQLRTIGNISKLPKDVQETLHETMDLTRSHTGMKLILALSYGGRDEITRAIRAIAQKVAEKKLTAEEIDQATVSEHLDTVGFPDPDLLIRTSGEMRTSNFLPWQMTYTEMYITDMLWPDFNESELHKAVAAYAKRERRFGLTGDQIEKVKKSA
jgi:undecaprenyl diphosphate synthase